MVRSFFSLLLVFLFFNESYGQHFKDAVVNKRWILVTEKVEISDSLLFVPFSKEKVSMNTMIWVFKPNGKIETDYQSSDDIEACAGVDFLDLDVESSFWKINPQTHQILLTLKGGYASIDDFLLKNEYVFTPLESGKFALSLKKKIFFKDYTLTINKP